MAQKETDVQVINVCISGGTTAIPMLSTSATWTDSIYVGDAAIANYPVTLAGLVTNITSLSNVAVFMEGGWSRPSIEGSYSPIYVSAASNTLNMTYANTWAYTALMTAAGTSFYPYIRFKMQGYLLNSQSIVTLKLLKKVSG
jgi:hypothetical protein